MVDRRMKLIPVAAGLVLFGIFPPCEAAARQDERPADLSAMNAEFDTTSDLDGWSWHHRVEGWTNKLKRMDVGETSPGTLYLEPYPTVWFHDYTAPFLFRLIDGDFVVTTRLNVSGLSTDVPQRTYSLSGLMAREPREGAPFTSDEDWPKHRENYVFVVTGTTGRPDLPYIETKSAVRSKPLVKHFAIDHSGWMELRLVRLGSSLVALYRFEGQSDWTIHERFYRPDLPREIQVGLMAYGDYQTISDRYWYHPWDYNTRVITDGAEDMKVEVDWIRFYRPRVSEEALAFIRSRGVPWEDGRITDDELRRYVPDIVAD